MIYEPFVLAAPPTPPPAPIIIKAGYEPLPEGTRIEMCFDIDKQKATWYPASVTKSHARFRQGLHRAELGRQELCQ